ncbi:DoxX family protein [Streptomyces marokkonensis]|uniref:DoxX family protein n=1 Tax=Streptomyces marokkonensis TaxID=324855 RepID=A0ABW6QH07_9ACTN
MSIALTAVAAVYGAFFLVSGVGHIVGRGVPRTPAAACGFSPAACRGIGVLELLGGAGLSSAHFVTASAAVAAGGLFLLTAAAFTYHDSHEQRGLRLWTPLMTATIMLCLSVGLPLSSVS